MPDSNMLEQLLEVKKKPTYKLSSSLLNSYLYYKKNPCKKNIDSIANYLNGEFASTDYTKRGLTYEDEVFEGKHGSMSELVKALPRNTWSNLLLKRDEFNIYLSGKRDAVDNSRQRIYDIKRVNEYKPENFSDSSTVQHLFYFILDKDKQEFYYLLAVSKTMTNNPEDIIFKVIPKQRPEESELEQLVNNSIDEFFNFLKEQNLWQLFTSTQKTNAGN